MTRNLRAVNKVYVFQIIAQFQMILRMNYHSIKISSPLKHHLTSCTDAQKQFTVPASPQFRTPL